MQRIKLDYTHAVDTSGTEGLFLTIDEIDAVKDRIVAAHQELQHERDSVDELSFLSLPQAYSDQYDKTMFGDVLIDAKTTIDRTAHMIRNQMTDYVQIAIGGSALGAIALINALGDGHNSGVRIHLPDNIDPEIIARILAHIDVKKTFFSVISKSGGTVETLSNFFVFYHALSQQVAPEKLKQHIAIMTNPDSGPLLDLCRQEDFILIPIPQSVHGRFSVLSPSGLLTSAVAGIDNEALLRGAHDIDQQTAALPFWENPLLIYTAVHYLLNTRKGLETQILIPYSNRISTVSDWYSQLVAESLGKEGLGLTPVKALGATDQHSQLQLYNEGPKNKFVLFFSLERYRSHIDIPSVFPSCTDYQYLGGNTLNDLIDSEQKATAISLTKHGVPNLAFTMPEISPYYMGQLLMLLEKTIPILGKLYNVNPFNQPGVEESKVYARAMMGKGGKVYSEKRDEIKSFRDPANLRIV